jgi:hypothetical protein
MLVVASKLNPTACIYNNYLFVLGRPMKNLVLELIFTNISLAVKQGISRRWKY